MEASTVTKTAPPEPAVEHDGEAEATRSTEELFQWATFVHVGTGADKCEHATDGKCQDRPSTTPDGSLAGHFHAWLSLPNSFQARDITDKANAAKARMRRALTHPDKEGNPTDAALVLDDGLSVWEANEQTWEALVNTIADRNIAAQLSEITEEMNREEQFEHHAADLEEYRRQMSLTEDERDADDWERLNTVLEAYRLELDKRANARFDREVQVLKETKRAEVLDMQRRWQIDQKAQEVWYLTYYAWAYYICAREPVAKGYPSKRIFDKPESLKNTAPEIAGALRENYRRLESRMLVRSDAAGN